MYKMHEGVGGCEGPRKELAVNTCMRPEIRLLFIYRVSHPTTAYTVLMRPIFVNATKTNDAVFNGDTL